MKLLQKISILIIVTTVLLSCSNKKQTWPVWKITSPKGKVSYAFGIAKFIDKSKVKFPEKIISLIDSSELIVQQIDFLGSNILEAKTIIENPGGKSLEELITEEEYNRIKNLFINELNTSKEQFDSTEIKIKPIYFHQDLFLSYYGNKVYYFDGVIQKLAIRKKMYGLETLQEYYTRLGTQSFENQKQQLMKTVANFTHEIRKIDDLNAAYFNNEEEYKKLYKEIYPYDSSPDMSKLIEILNHTSSFIAIEYFYLIDLFKDPKFKDFSIENMGVRMEK